jgi:hypothetical protein
MEELGEEYGSMLLQLGRLDREQGRYKEAPWSNTRKGTTTGRS